MTRREFSIFPSRIPRGAPLIVIQWTLLPILGKFSGFLFLMSMPLMRSQSGRTIPELRTFFVISVIYTLFITGRALTASGDAIEPIGSTIPLLLAAGLSLWVAREPSRLDMAWLFRGCVVMLSAVFLLTMVERFAFGVWRPELLLGNPLNLAPLMLVPCMLVTMREFAPGRLWVFLGFFSFCLGGYVIGGLSQSRGMFLGLVALVCVRLLFEMTSPAALRARVITSLSLVVAIVGLVAVVALNPAISGRYAAAAQTLSASTAEAEWSTGLRVTMLKEGWRAFLERPLFGHGPQNRFDAVFPDPSSFPIRLSHLHNDFLTHGVGGGMIAVVLLFLVLAVPGWAGCRNPVGIAPETAHLRRQIGVLTSCAFVGVAVVNNVFFVSISSYTTALSLISALLILAALRRAEQNINPARSIALNA